MQNPEPPEHKQHHNYFKQNFRQPALKPDKSMMMLVSIVTLLLFMFMTTLRLTAGFLRHVALLTRFEPIVPTRRSVSLQLNYKSSSDIEPGESSVKQQTGPKHKQTQDKEEEEGIKALRYLSTELGVRWLQGNLQDGDRVTPLFLVIVERVLDTIEDAFLHLRRIPYEWGWRQQGAAPKDCTPNKKTVVVLGSGWAAHAFLKVVDTEKLRVVAVSPVNHFVFTPMLAGAAVGTVEYRSMTEAVRSANPTMEEFIEGEAVDIDFQAKTVKVQFRSLLDLQKSNTTGSSAGIIELKYDALVAAVGVQSANLQVPGARDNCFKLKTCEDARKLRVAIGESFEYASRPDIASKREEHTQERSRRVTFVIVGGGPTGVELAGELSDFIKDITKPRVGAYPELRDFAKIILVQSGPALLPAFEESLRNEALRALERSGVDVRLETKTIEVGERFVKLQAHDEQEEVVPAGITIWCAGTSPQSFTFKMREKLEEATKAPNGRIYVDPWMRAITEDANVLGSVFVLGDAACFRDKRHQDANGNVSGCSSEQYLPQTAQVAGQQGAYVARLLSRGYDLSGSPPLLLAPKKFAEMSTSEYIERKWLQIRSLEVADPFIFVNLGLLAYVGGGEALSQVQLGDTPLFSYAGSSAFMLWRSVYLVKQVATRNRVLVTFDWIKSYLFGRDVTRL